MGGLVIMLVLLTPLAALYAFGARSLSARRFPLPVRPWVRAAAYALSTATATYLWGAWHLFAWNISAVCSIRSGQPYDPAYDQVTLWPLGRKCNASFDLVPGYVNPTLVVLLTATVLSVAVATGVAYANRRRPPPPPG